MGKEKLLVMSNFSFSHSVFKKLASQARQIVSLCGNGLIVATFQMSSAVSLNLGGSQKGVLGNRLNGTSFLSIRFVCSHKNKILGSSTLEAVAMAG